MYILIMELEYNKFDFVISDIKKQEFEKNCRNLSKEIIKSRQNPQNIDHKKLNKNRRIIIEKLNNIENIINKLEKLQVARYNDNKRIIETFNIVKFTGSALDVFKRWVEKAKKEFTRIIDAAHDFAKDAVSSIEDLTTDIYNKTAGEITKSFDDALNLATGVINNAKDFAVDTYNKASEVALDTIDTVAEGTLDIVNKVYEGLETAWSAVTDTFYKLAGDLTDFVGDLGKMGEHLLKGLKPKTTKRKNVKTDYLKASIENSPHKILLSDDDQELTSADITTDTLITSKASESLSEMGVKLKIEYDQSSADNELDSTIKDINELNIPGVKYNETGWNETKKFNGDLGECKPGVCLESFDNNNLSLKPFNYFNNYSSF